MNEIKLDDLNLGASIFGNHDLRMLLISSGLLMHKVLRFLKLMSAMM